MNPRARRFAVWLVVPCLLAGCAKRERAVSEEAPAAESAAAPQATRAMAAGASAPSAPAAPKPSPRKLIKTVEIAIEVRDPEAVAARLQALAEQLGGYVSGVGGSRMPDGSMQVALTLRIPVERLDAARAEVRKLAAKVLSEQLRTEDVTDQLVDLDARLKTLRATEAELQALLAESRSKARKVEEIMAVYRELTEIRTQIEQIGAQRLGLDRQVSYSTLQVQVYPIAAARPVTGEGWRPGDTLRGSVRTLLSVLRGLGDFAIFAVVVLVPVGAILWLVLRVLRRVWRRRRRPNAPVPRTNPH